MLSQASFLGLVLLVAIQRLGELALSRRNESELRRLGAREHAPRQLLPMQLLHGFWLVSMLLEVRFWAPPPRPWLAVVAALTFGAGQALRHAARRTLGQRWTVGIYTLPGAPPITSGIYRYLRHPNYLGVALEIAALPLIHGAFRTCLLFSAGNALLLALRIRAEERALFESGGYEVVALRPRLWPSLRARGVP